MAPQIDQALPQAHGLPFLGVLPALIKHPFDFFLDARERYGDIYILNLGLSQLVVLNHPRHAHHVLLDHDHNYRKGGALWDSLRTLLGNGLPVSEAVTLFLAGYETTSLTLAWAYHLLIQHPDTMLKLQTEIDSVIGNRIPTAADLPQLSYTRWVVQEALRLRPPGWWLPRTAIATDMIDGFVIPAGTNVVLLTYVIQHHPDYWNHPAQFDPERFRSAPQHPCALILAMITQRYHIRAVPGRTAELQLASTLKPKGGVFAHLTNRSVSIS